MPATFVSWRWSVATSPRGPSVTPACSSPRPALFARAADRPHHAVEGTERLPAREAQALAVAADSSATGTTYGTISMPSASHGRHEPRGEHLVEGAQHAVVADREGHARAERGEDAAEFGRDVAAADDRDRARHAAERKETIGGDCGLRARQFRHERPAAGRDDDVFRRMHRAADPDAARRFDVRALAKERRAPSLQVLQVDAAQLFDISIAPRLERRPVMARGLEREAVVGRIHQGVREVGRVVHDFLRHAADVDAGAAEGPGSATAARAPWRAARWAQASPPLPPPITIRSHDCVMLYPRGCREGR